MNIDAPIHVLLVEDNLVDVDQVKSVFAGLRLEHDLTVLPNARQAIGYAPEDDSEVRFAAGIADLLAGGPIPPRPYAPPPPPSAR